MLEFVARFINIARALNLHGSLLKPQFSSLVYTFSPVLCHVVLLIYSQFMDAFEGDEDVILKRLFYLCRETHQPLPVRLLGVHWLLGVENLQKDKHSVIAPLASGLYPLVFDPLSLKAAKLVALAHCAASLASSSSSPLVSKSPPLTPNPQPKLKPQTSSSPGNRRVGLYKVLAIGDSPVDPASRILDEGLLCVSAFTWLPSSSTETYTTFHALHKFLTAAIPHQNQSSALEVAAFTDSSLFKTIQLILVKMALKLRYLVPQILALLDRLMECNTHQSLGEHLLRTFNEDLLPELEPNCNLPAYFPLIERLAENVDIPPVGLLGLLTIYVRKRVEEHKGDGGLKLWLRGSQVNKHS
jgi:AP-5 complex subunit beta-1